MLFSRRVDHLATCFLIAILALGFTGCASGPEKNRPTVTVTGKTLEEKTAERLGDVELAWNNLAASASKPEEVRLKARAKYREAIETFLVYLADLRKLPEWKGAVPLSGGGRRYVLDIPPAPAGHKQWDITSFDSFRISSQVPIKSMDDPTRVEGLGAPLVLRKHSTGEPFVFQSGLNCPATAVIDFSGGGRGTLRFYDPREQPRLGTATLAADCAAPIELSVNVKDFRDIEFAGVFRVDKFKKVRGLYITEPYRPDKIPVVLVHGLQSSPLTWTKMINDLNADPALGTRYQFWYYSYPSGVGWTIAAPEFRDDLNNASAHFGAMGGRENINRTIVVGHSMGGLLTRMMVTDSGDTFWTSLFDKAPDQVDWPSPDARTRFMKTLFFKRVPNISAAVFIATPHRGSTIADWFVVALIKKLIRLPAGVASALVNVATLNVQGMRVDIGKVTGFGTSVTGLSPKNPSYPAMNTCVIKVPFYTIIADHKAGGDLLKYPDPVLLVSNDKVVPYWSSHLDEAVSEAIVHTVHTKCTAYKGTVAEMRRILGERLAGKLGKAPTRPPGILGPGGQPQEALLPPDKPKQSKIVSRMLADGYRASGSGTSAPTNSKSKKPNSSRQPPASPPKKSATSAVPPPAPVSAKAKAAPPAALADSKT